MSLPSEASSADCRCRIIAAAVEAFRQEGYRASIERIAQLAGVARQTLYNHFPGKDALFAEMTRQCNTDIRIALNEEAGDIREILLRFGAILRQRLLGDEGLDVFRALLGEAARFPDLARAFFENGPQRTLTLLAEVMEQAMRRDQLRHDSAQFAAEMFAGMLLGIERTRLLCCVGAYPATDESLRIVRIVDCFLAAFAPSSTR